MSHTLIHACGAAQHTASHVGNPCHFQNALKPSVLAVSAMEHRKDNVHFLDEGLAVLDGDNAAVQRIRRKNCRCAVRILFPCPCGDLRNIPREIQPSALFGDADADHLVLLLGNAPDHVFCRDQRNIMLTGNAAEQYGHSNFCHV